MNQLVITTENVRGSESQLELSAGRHIFHCLCHHLPGNRRFLTPPEDHDWAMSNCLTSAFRPRQLAT